MNAKNYEGISDALDDAFKSQEQIKKSQQEQAEKGTQETAKEQMSEYEKISLSLLARINKQLAFQNEILYCFMPKRMQQIIIKNFGEEIDKTALGIIEDENDYEF